MMRQIDRFEAIKIICSNKLPEISLEERFEQLESMMFENWKEHSKWSTIPSDVRKEFAEHSEITDPMDNRYDPVLMIWLESSYVAVKNSYLLTKLREYGLDYDEIIGDPITLLSCPCCGYRTLSSHGDYQICEICWWEDDAQDNQDANLIRGGPNARLSLTRARFNFLKYGIANPDPKDLMEYQEAPEKYEKGRFFEIASDGKSVLENVTGWFASLDEEHGYS